MNVISRSHFPLSLFCLSLVIFLPSLPTLSSFFSPHNPRVVNCYYARWVWYNCITLSQVHHIWLRTTACEGSLLMRSRAAEFVGGSVKRPAEAALIELLSFWQLLLFLQFFQIFGSRQEVPTLWARSDVTLFPDLTTTKWNRPFSSAYHLPPSVLCTMGITEYFKFLKRAIIREDMRVGLMRITHGQCSFLRSSRYECSHTHTCPLHTLHTHSSADRGNNSMGSLWKTRGRTHVKDC